MVDPARFDRRITIQRKTTTQNDLGEKVETWSDLVTVLAARRDVSDSERIAAAEVSATITTRFQIRWSTNVQDVNPGGHRILFGDRLYDIAAVKEVGRREGIEITAAARAE